MILKYFPLKIRNTLFPFLNEIMKKSVIKNWENKNKPIPPPHQIKQSVIERYQKTYNCNVFIESGTLYGDMVEAQKNNFEQIYSIELAEKLWKSAVKRFKNYSHVKILYGDSSKVLHDICSSLTQSAVFWLDGHYSGGITARGEKDCPIFEELDAILKLKDLNHVILIDDARLFTGKNDYPTIDHLKKYIASKNSRYKVFVEETDIIRCIIDN